MLESMEEQKRRRKKVERQRETYGLRSSSFDGSRSWF